MSTKVEPSAVELPMRALSAIYAIVENDESPVGVRVRKLIDAFYPTFADNRRQYLSTECPHLLPKELCALCSAPEVKETTGWRWKPKGTPRVVERKTTLPTTKAIYTGGCPGCGSPIFEGQRIYLVDGQWVDEACAT